MTVIEGAARAVLKNSFEAQAPITIQNGKMPPMTLRWLLGKRLPLCFVLKPSQEGDLVSRVAAHDAPLVPGALSSKAKSCETTADVAIFCRCQRWLMQGGSLNMVKGPASLEVRGCSAIAPTLVYQVDDVAQVHHCNLP